MKKTILYLDQNFASNLAKVENLPDWNDPQRDFYGELLKMLRLRTIEDKLACPTSPFHQEESEQGARVKDFIWHVVRQLSFGLAFLHSNKINFCQIEAAARTYCRLPESNVPGWTIAFNRNPHESIKLLAKSPQVLVHIPSAQELVDYYKKSRSLIADTYLKFKNTRKGKSGTYQEEIQFQKAQVVYEIFLPPRPINIGPPQLNRFLYLLGAPSIVEFHAYIWNILDRCEYPIGFFSSEELMEAPFIHIRASLMAADIYFYPDMAPSPSINTDFDIIASVLPYTDILATDNHMAELIRQTKILDRFGCKVFSMRKRQKLLEILRNM